MVLCVRRIGCYIWDSIISVIFGGSVGIIIDEIRKYHNELQMANTAEQNQAIGANAVEQNQAAGAFAAVA